MATSGVGLLAPSSRVNSNASTKEDERSQLEKEALEKEFAWLLETEYHAKLDAMSKCMEECSKKFSIVLNPSLASGGEPLLIPRLTTQLSAKQRAGSKDVRPILLTSPQQGDAILCTAAVDGDKITKAELTLKLPGRGSKPLRTTIKEHAPWKLKQIQDSANYFQLAQEQYRDIQANREALCSPEQISKTFNKFMGSLRQAEEVLVLPRLPNMQEIYGAEMRSHLKPELPEDIALHFYISSSLLILTVFTVTQTPKSGTSSQKGDTDSWLGSTFDHGASTYEVSGQTQVESKVPWLANVLQLLQETLELAQDLIDKVQVFEAIGLSQSNS